MVKQAMSVELYPKPSTNTLCRLTLTSAYMNGDDEMKGDLDEAICAISECKSPSDINACSLGSMHSEAYYDPTLT